MCESQIPAKQVQETSNPVYHRRSLGLF